MGTIKNVGAAVLERYVAALSFRGSEASRGICVFPICLADIQCEDPSTRLRLGRDDKTFGAEKAGTVCCRRIPYAERILATGRGAQRMLFAKCSP